VDLGLKNKVAVVLAASKGLGRGCAQALADEGALLALCARDAASLETTADELRGKTRVFARTCDVTDKAASEEFLASVLKEYGRVDILINNCGGRRRVIFRLPSMKRPGSGPLNAAFCKWRAGQRQ